MEDGKANLLHLSLGRVGVGIFGFKVQRWILGDLGFGLNRREESAAAGVVGTLVVPCIIYESC